MALAWNAGWVNSPQGFESPILRQPRSAVVRLPLGRSGRGFVCSGPVVGPLRRVMALLRHEGGTVALTTAIRSVVRRTTAPAAATLAGAAASAAFAVGDVLMLGRRVGPEDRRLLREESATSTTWCGPATSTAPSIRGVPRSRRPIGPNRAHHGGPNCLPTPVASNGPSRSRTPHSGSPSRRWRSRPPSSSPRPLDDPARFTRVGS